jgi:hypothetical protein
MTPNFLPPTQSTRWNGLVSCKKGQLPTHQQIFDGRALFAWALIIVAVGLASLAIVLL